MYFYHHFLVTLWVIRWPVYWGDVVNGLCFYWVCILTLFSATIPHRPQFSVSSFLISKALVYFSFLCICNTFLIFFSFLLGEFIDRNVDWNGWRSNPPVPEKETSISSNSKLPPMLSPHSNLILSFCSCSLDDPIKCC